jgi:uncharacterized HAD superfamily protein
VRIAIDIDSTLHHYWDQLETAAKRRFGVELPYAEQLEWTIDRLRPEQVKACVAETHTDEQILAAEPYDAAVETIRAWHEAGHFIHVTSHRTTDAHAATAQWLERIGLPYDELACSDDPLDRCRAAGVDVLVDDSPAVIAAALDDGVVAATLLHPWNREVCETDDVICADDWPGLERALAPTLAAGGPSRSGG